MSNDHADVLFEQINDDDDDDYFWSSHAALYEWPWPQTGLALALKTVSFNISLDMYMCVHIHAIHLCNSHCQCVCVCLYVCLSVCVCVCIPVSHLGQWLFIGNLHSKLWYDADDAVRLLKSSYAGDLWHRSSCRSLVVTITTVLLSTLAHVQVCIFVCVRRNSSDVETFHQYHYPVMAMPLPKESSG